jgi:tripartite-type tricarboxylate transporter receptor subunit TctC
MSRLLTGLAAFVLIAAASTAQGQSYPTRPVTLIVPLAAGTGMDTLARLYAEPLGQALGKPVVIENKPGAALLLGTTAIATAAPDGYTIGISTSTPLAGYKLYKKVNYDPEKDFAPIYLYVKSPFILVVDPKLPVKTVSDLVTYAKASATPLNYSSAGPGSSQHLAMEFLAQTFGLSLTHVPYRSTPQAITDIVAGHVGMGFAEAGASLPLIREGKLRALAVSAATRLPTLPDVPTVAETPGAAGFEAVSWHVLLAPGATSREIVERLHGEMRKIMTPEMQKRAADIGLLPIESPSLDGIRAYIKSEQAKLTALVQKLGLEGSQ